MMRETINYAVMLGTEDDTNRQKQLTITSK